MIEIFKQIPKSIIIRKPVGSGGFNDRGDVLLVQALLNDWLARSRHETLVIDGLIGPKTIRGIRRFQQRETGIVDGRCDPFGPAIKKLAELHFEYVNGNLLMPGLQYIAKTDGHSKRAISDVGIQLILDQLNAYWAVLRNDNSIT